MIKIFSNPAQIEKEAKQRLGIPDFLMMEHAAENMASFIINNYPENPDLLILTGKGNNGADGYALARLLLEKKYPSSIFIYSFEPPKGLEAETQFKMCSSFKADYSLEFISDEKLSSLLQTKNPARLLIVDCIYGTGFKGELPQNVAQILRVINKTDFIKIACDVPSGLRADGSISSDAFCADITISMGGQKLSFYSDGAKDITGKIISVNLGIPQDAFYGKNEADAYLIEKDDAKLPFRKKRSVHKGKFGHTVVFPGDKGGACILAAEAAMCFGSGLTSILDNRVEHDIHRFKILPEIMITESLPKKTSCVILGPGVVCQNLTDDQIIMDYFNNKDKKHAGVFDAGVFDTLGFVQEIELYSNQEGSQIVLTPHLYELSRFCTLIKQMHPDVDFTLEDITVENFSSLPEIKIRVGKEINRLLPNAALVMKSADTFIAYKQKIYIVTDGCQSLAKGGSGDILAGMTGALLAQGYDAGTAAITACEAHALAAKEIGETAFNLTPQKLLEKISELYSE